MNTLIKIVLLSIVYQKISCTKNKKQVIESASTSIEESEEDTNCFPLKTLDDNIVDVYPHLQHVNLENLKSQIRGFKKLPFLGQGGNGTIYALTPQSKSQNKKLDTLALKYQLIDQDGIEMLEEEVENYIILHGIKGIPQLHGCFYKNSGESGKFEYFLLQTKLHHDLNQPQFLDKKQKKKNPKNILNALPNISQRYRFYQQIFEAIDAMAKQNLIHNDLKPENMMVDENGYENGPYLIDFGLTTDKNESAQVTTICYEFINKKKNTLNTQHLDVYSAAVSILELEYGSDNVCQVFWEEVGENYKDLNVQQPSKDLFKDIVLKVVDQETYDPLKENEKKPAKVTDCDNLNCIILYCLQHNIKKIPTAQQVIKAFNNLLTKKKKII